MQEERSLEREHTASEPKNESQGVLIDLLPAPAYDRRGREQAATYGGSWITSWYVAVWLAGFLFLCFTYFLPHTDWNQTARLDMTVATVDQGTFAIDKYHGNTGDDDFFGGHYYITKAPGQSLLGIPIYLAYKAYLGHRGGIPRDTANDLYLRYLDVIFTAAIPAVLFLVLFFWFLGYFSPSLVNRAVLTLALGLGTIIFSYAQNLYGHVTAAALLFGAFVLVYLLAHPEAVQGPGTRWLIAHPEITALLAGLALGAVVLLEFPPALIGLCIAVYALRRIPRAHLAYLVVGAAPPLMMLLAYNYAVYRNPFTLGYTSGASLQFRQQLGQGIAGFTWPPHLDAIWGMSFSPYRGLFFQSPFLLLAFPGYWMWRRRDSDDEWLLFLIIPIVFFLAISMYAVWWGGYAAGPRHLIPMLPFLALPIIFVLDRVSQLSRRDMARIGVYALIVLSAMVVWTETIAVLWPQEGMLDPLFTYSIPFLQAGALTLNRGMTEFKLSGLASMGPLFSLLAAWSILVFAFPAYQRLTAASERREMGT